MSLTYFRKSNKPLEETAKNITELAAKANWKVLGEIPFPDKSGTMVLVCKPEWVKIVLQEDRNLIAFLPCAISVYKQNGTVFIGTGQPGTMKAISKNPALVSLAKEADAQIKDLIHKAAGIKELKPTQVKLYSTQTCPYCKMEKIWLDDKKIKHQLVYVDQDQEEAQKMVAATGQMGVPVTEIQFEEGDPEYIIGFDQARLTELLGI